MASDLVTGVPGALSEVPDLSLVAAAEGLSRDNAKFGSRPDEKGSNRRGRYARRKRVGGLALHVESVTGFRPSWARVRTCGLPLRDEVEIKARDGRCYCSGVAQCASVWVCPVCSAKIRTRRQIELEQAATRHVEMGGQLAMVTMTLRHNRSLGLFVVLGALLLSFRKIRHRKSWRAVRSLSVGIVRSLEVTLGVNGWHPHLHLLLFLKSGVDRGDVDSLLGDVVTDWRSLLGGALDVLPPSVERAIDLTWFGGDSDAAAHYVSKIAQELTQSDVKSGKTSSPFALLDVSGEGRDEAVALFVEYADVMRGVQSTSWTKGLRELLGMGRAKLDEDLVIDEDQGDEVVEVVERRAWIRVWKVAGEGAFFDELESRLRRRKVFECDEWGEVVSGVT